MDDWSEPTADAAKRVSPDCRGGLNCHKCDRNAWDEINDQPTDCGCDCHQEAR